MKGIAEKPHAVKNVIAMMEGPAFANRGLAILFGS